MGEKCKIMQVHSVMKPTLKQLQRIYNAYSGCEKTESFTYRKYKNFRSKNIFGYLRNFENYMLKQFFYNEISKQRIISYGTRTRV